MQDLNIDFLKNMKELFKNDYEDFISSYNLDTKNGIRCNNIKLQTNNLSENVDFPIYPIKWCKDGFYYENGIRPGKTIQYHQGLFYMQEPSAMIVGSVCPINKGDKVLDLCAAPGGKTTHIGSKLNNTGVIVSNDISASRCRGLIKNIELMGITNAIVTSENPKKLAKKYKGYFNKILVDAPCSGEGMFRKNTEVLKSWDIEKPLFYNELQKEILSYAISMLEENGVLSYSTCTFNTVENEQVINWVLENYEDMELIKLDHENLGIEKGYNINKNNDLTKTGRILPHKQQAEGHFIALLKKNGKPLEQFSELEETDLKLPESYVKFVNEYIIKNTTNYLKNIKIINNQLYLLPDNCPSLKGIRVGRSGLCLGEIKNNRFLPSQSLAMVLNKNNFKNCAELDTDNSFRYLKGESFQVKGNDGWCLLINNGFSLGFGKVIDGRMKNKYAKSWIYTS